MIHFPKLIAALGLLTPLAGCGGISTMGVLGGSHAPSNTALTCPTKVGVIGVVIDATESTGGQLVAPAKDLIKQNLNDLVAGTECGRRLYIRKLTQASWGLENSLLVAWIPPIDALPAAPVKGVFESLVHFHLRQAEYRTQKAMVASQRTAARSVVRGIDRNVDQMHVPIENVASDINGAFVKFGDVDQSLGGPRYLLALTDFLPAGPQTPGRPDMTHTKVSGVIYCGAQESAQQCRALHIYWYKRLQSGGATSVELEDTPGYMFIRHAFS